MLSGTFRPDRHAGAGAPEPPAGKPKSPKKLAGDAKAEWKRMVLRLEQLGIVSMVDAGALYQYCRLFAETEALCNRQAELEGSIGILEENLSGLKGVDLVACFQEITKMRQLQAGLDTKIRQGRMGQRVYLVEFGLTPSSRSRVKTEKTTPPRSNSLTERYLNVIPGGRQ